jgi:hypothetical protein
MNPGQAHLAESRRQTLLSQLHAAESAVRSNLNFQAIEANARAHMERALAHIREACVAINAIDRARTVKQLVDELERLERAFDELRQQPPPGVTVKSNRI